MTATRLAAVLGLNNWTTPFNAWCAITRTYEEPFVDTIYTAAGKTIEPKQISYMRRSYLMDNLKTPSDIYGPDYFKKTYGDFFPERKIFGGMWDSILVDENGKPDTVLEFKTTKRSEDWEDDVPEYYAIQAALYAYLLGVDDVIMVCSFLRPTDYEHPEDFLCTARNTVTRTFKVSERYPQFPLTLKKVEDWWHEHVETGISPDFDEKADADILKVLRQNSVSPDTDVAKLIAEAEALKAELDEAAAAVADKEKRLKKITDVLKDYAQQNFREGDKTVTLSGSRYIWTCAKSVKDEVKVNEDALKADGLYEKYTVVTPKTTYRMTVAERKE